MRTPGGRTTTGWSLDTTTDTTVTRYLATTSNTNIHHQEMEETTMMIEKPVTTVTTLRITGIINLMKTTFIACINITRRITRARERVYLYLLTSLHFKNIILYPN